MNELPCPDIKNGNISHRVHSSHTRAAGGGVGEKEPPGDTEEGAHRIVMRLCHYTQLIHNVNLAFGLSSKVLFGKYPQLFLELSNFSVVTAHPTAHFLRKTILRFHWSMKAFHFI